jgi:hypothetical protein
MSNASAQSQASIPIRWLREDHSVLTLGGLLLATSILRFVVGAGQPLWLDETWTGMIASQTSLAG